MLPTRSRGGEGEICVLLDERRREKQMYVRGQRERRTNLREECAKGKERDRERHYTRANNQAEIKPAATITPNLCLFKMVFTPGCETEERNFLIGCPWKYCTLIGYFYLNGLQ